MKAQKWSAASKIEEKIGDFLPQSKKKPHPKKKNPSPLTCLWAHSLLCHSELDLWSLTTNTWSVHFSGNLKFEKNWSVAETQSSLEQVRWMYNVHKASGHVQTKWRFSFNWRLELILLIQLAGKKPGNWFLNGICSFLFCFTRPASVTALFLSAH